MPNSEVVFLYPKSKAYPIIDEVCEQIVREIEKRDWNVPGMKVEFNDYTHGDKKYRHVSTIEGDDFKLYFSRQQDKLGEHHVDNAAVRTINIPKMEISVYSDLSGPAFYNYIGNDWEADKVAFGGTKINSKADNEPRIYLYYEGRYKKGELAERLEYETNRSREYGPEGEEAKSHNTSIVLQTFGIWLTDCVLKKILAQPITTP